MPKFTWPEEGPDEWFRQLFELLPEAEIYVAGKMGDRLTDFIKTWKNVPNMARIIDHIIRTLEGSDDDDSNDDGPQDPNIKWTSKKLHRRTRNDFATWTATGEARKSRVRGSAFYANPQFDGSPPPNNTKNNKRKRMAQEPVPQEFALRGAKCWGCVRDKNESNGLDFHDLRACPFFRKRRSPVTAAEQAHWEKRMADKKFKEFVDSERERMNVKRDLPEIKAD